jgi:hypothetical protein
MWQRRQSRPSPARDLRRRLVLGLALVLQIFAVTVLQAGHLSAGLGGKMPCPMHPGMMMSGHADHQPGQPASPSENCPCCGVACACNSVQLALQSADFELIAPFAIGTSESRIGPKVVKPARRQPAAAYARGPPSLVV